MIKIGMTFEDTETGQKVDVPLRDFEAKPLTSTKFDTLLLACYEYAGADGTPGENRMDDLRLLTSLSYRDFVRIFHRYEKHHAELDDLDT